MIELSGDALEWLAIGTLLTLVGALIRFRGWTFLLAGYDESSSDQDDVVQDIAGNTILRIGIVVFVVGVLQCVISLPPYLPVVVSGLIVLDVVRLIYRINTGLPSWLRLVAIVLGTGRISRSGRTV